MCENVKALISIGGWTGSQYFSSHVGDAQNRTAFVNTCYKLLTDNNLDGLDFDWEYPGTQGMGCNAVSENDSANFILFLSELRTKMGPDYMITLAVSILPFAVGDPTAPSRMTDVSEVANYVDHIAIMAYDINGPYASPEKVGANAPLDDSCADIKSGSATSAVAAWTAAKFPVDKIVLGVPAYGHSFNVPVANALVNDKIALYSTFIHPTPFGDGETAADFGNNKNDACGNPTLPGGVFDFEALISAGFLSAGGSPMTDIWYTMDNCSHTPFLYNKTSEVMVSFDDATSFNSKGQFINDNKLKGFAIWDATGDYNDILLDSISGAMGIESVCS
ncbi:hypothetical protein DXG01_007760 [Tephrocybe rancida]|nr:hypothetical protein DXG01_007760 [Tephrocybe rancida]